MKKTILIIGALLFLSIAAIGIYLFRPSPEASAPIQASPVSTQPQSAATSPTVEQVSPPVGPVSQGSEIELSGSKIYRISQEESEVRFSLDEILRGKPFRPVGITNQVAGEISLDFDRKQAQVGAIQVNARTLKTDSEMRDRMIQNEILKSFDFEYITFIPSEISGLPQKAAFGTPVNFQITGELTIRDVTQTVTFDVSATLVDANRLEGSARATVLRSDYGLVIPNVPSVTEVSNEVLLEIDFIALAS